MSDQPAGTMQAGDVWQPPSLRVVNPTADKKTFEEALADARQQGYMEGFAKGEADGQEAGRKQAQALLADMTAIWDAIQKPFADMEEHVHTELLGVAVALAKAVVRRELRTDSSLIQKSLDDALSRLGNAETTIEVQLNPKDADMITALLTDELVDHRIKVDPGMMAGGCRIKQGSAYVDASLEAMISNCINEICDGSRLVDADGNETSAALDSAAIQAVADRFSSDAGDG